MKTATMQNGRPLTDEERLTRSGKILRRTSIDELPQLFNIIRGEMSFIGPRPFLINDLGTYSEEQLARFEVLPGLTGWAAIHGRNTLTIQQKYDYEVEYVRRFGFLIDCKIFFKTMSLILKGVGIEDHINQPRLAALILNDEDDDQDKQ